MAKKTNTTFEIKDVISVISESDSSDWCKAVARISWNENPSTLDIRRLNMSNLDIYPKGIGLTDEEADRLTDILLENEYGTIDALNAALERRRNRYTISKDQLPPDDKVTVIRLA
jgi:hypothetical protein